MAAYTGVCTDRHGATSQTTSSPAASDAAPRRLRLRSVNRNCLTVPRCRFSTYGCRAFHYAGPTVWNSLPDELRNSDSFDNFKRFL